MTNATRRRKRNHQNSAPTLSITDLEQTIVNESLQSCEDTKLDSPCSIHIHSKRNYLTDSDGVSAKAAIDGFVYAGILEDDSPKYVEEVTYSQEKVTGEEETIITIWRRKKSDSQ